MKKIFYAALLALSTFTFSSCDDPKEGITITLDNADIFKYKSSFRLTNAKDGAALPNGISVAITGPDAASIYSLDGKKNFTVTNGVVQFGVDPHLEVTDARPLKFNFIVTGESILDMNFPVTLTKQNQFQERVLYILDLNNPAPGVSVETFTFTGDLTAGVANKNISISSKPENNTNLVTSVTFPNGTQFKNASNQVISGSELKATIVNIDPRSIAGLRVFPGGSLSSDQIKNSADQVVSGTFNPATVTDIELTVGGQRVAFFDGQQPVVKQDIDPTYVSSQTGRTSQIGDVISVYSYTVASGMFDYERVGTVVSSNTGAGVALQYPITHLSTYTGSELEGACNSTTLALQGTWMQDGVTYPLRLKVQNVAGANIYETVLSVTKNNNGNLVALQSIPSSNVRVIVEHASTGQVLANTPIVVNCGGGAIDITLSAPTEQPVVSLQLYVRCPNQAQQVEILPTFILYYRPAGNGQFKLLGEVQGGFISTTALSTTTAYDFMGVWGSRSKTVNNKTVGAVNVAHVGDDKTKNEIIGQYAPQNNLEMLKQACNEL